MIGVVAILALAAYLSEGTRFEKTSQMLLGLVMWNSVITTVQTSYIVTVYDAITSIVNLSTGNGSLEQDLVSPVILAFFASFVGTFFFLRRFEREELAQPAMRARYGAFYNNLRILRHSPRSALLQPSLFYAKRLLMCVFAAAYMNEFSWG